MAEQTGTFDRVLVDAPCSGSGNWRRDPEARWRLTPTDLQRYCETQRLLLERAAPLVRERGRLIYVTCSLLKMENRDQITAFLARHGEFAPVALAPLWSAVGLAGACPAEGHELLLTPARHGTDGFYLAVLERSAPGREQA
jgi:16S rRNA (cytosine967-C5)-methyltransferase